MSYAIHYISHGHVAAVEPCSGTLEICKALAVGAVKTGSAERVEVRDDHDRLVFDYRRAMSEV